MILQNTSLHICSYSKYALHGLFKIIKNYVNNKIINYFFQFPNQVFLQTMLRSYKTQMMITSVIEMLEWPNYVHMSTSLI